MGIVRLVDGVAWSSPGVCNVRATRAEIERAHGTPVKGNCDSNGTGLFDLHAVRFPCGLELALWAFDEGAEVYANEDDTEHVLRHLGLPRERVTDWLGADGAWTDDPARAARVARFRLTRTDDNGRSFAMRETRSRAHAQCLADELEARGHKQTYSVEAIGVSERSERGA